MLTQRGGIRLQYSKEFREPPALYAAAYRNWWLGDITEHMEVRRFWTEDEIFDAARPYKTELSSSKVTAEHTKLRGVVISWWGMRPYDCGETTNRSLDKKEIMKVSRQKSYKDFSNNARGAYLAAVQWEWQRDSTLYNLLVGKIGREKMFWLLPKL